jgi:hypothetical protein
MGNHACSAMEASGSSIRLSETRKVFCSWAGAVLLMRTNALKAPPSPTDEYGRRAQASERVEDAARQTMAVAAKGAEMWGEEVATRLDDTTSRTKSTGQALLDDVCAKQHDLRDQVEDVAAKAADKFRDEDTRNNLLLGLAGLAIAAALGVACQKRILGTAAD